MLTAMLAVENILGSQHDLWAVNADDDYHEEIKEEDGQSNGASAIRSTQPLVPQMRARVEPKSSNTAPVEAERVRQP